jgi:2,4-dienoyl-CoA reductase-like NADH-dependent reductase (Old Yellow Enzyme family)
MEPKHQSLFEPISIRTLQLANRVALAPTYVGTGDDKGNVTDQTLCYYYARAAGGVGLVIVEITGATGRYAFSAGFGLGAASDKNIPGLRDLARVIHWGGAKAVLQITAGQGAQALYHHERRPLVGPSDVPALIQREALPKALEAALQEAPQVPRPLTLEEIESLKASVVRAAVRAKRAGFDGVELHGAHGYLLAQFTSPHFNRRQDAYGGSPEKRWRLSLELVRKVREEVGERFVIGYRLSAREGIPGGLDLPESLEMAMALEGAGVDYLSVSRGCYGALTGILPKEEGAITADASAIRKSVSVPVVCPNFQDPDRAAQAITDGSVDLVALSRALLADPLWVRKVRDGESRKIERCVRCYRCFRDAIVTHLPVRCTVNPMLGFERFAPTCLPRPLKETKAP